ncbi:MAG: hypothetical protein KA751_07005 [Comamonas sp.]|uniref:YrbL family protein n=1 Tax=Comamonas aquatica TaxID=225991 RepID=UPI001B7119CE|nr:YrbL family protein [Comamonas aquatica]MBP7646486.1 hypothetical protein [Comamonas sp.]MDH0494629.1 PhoP regulatory network YrbL family protein [Comamonas aquatica]
MLKVEQLKKISQGTVKDIYLHPEDATKLIKLIKPELVDGKGCFIKHGTLKGNYQQGIYRQFRREILQYLQLCKNGYAQKNYVFPIETPYGFIATDQGLGLVTERIQDTDGQSLTLEVLAKKRMLEDKHLQALARFFDDCVRLHVVFGEVNDAGLIYTESRNGRPEFVLVDGIGEKLLIPMRSMFASVNARYIRKVQQRIHAQIAEIERSKAARTS